MAKSDELVKYITQRVVTYIDTPKETRLQERENRRKPKEPWTVRWFGLIPMALGLWTRKGLDITKDLRSRRDGGQYEEGEEKSISK